MGKVKLTLYHLGKQVYTNGPSEDIALPKHSSCGRGDLYALMRTEGYVGGRRKAFFRQASALSQTKISRNDPCPYLTIPLHFTFSIALRADRLPLKKATGLGDVNPASKHLILQVKDRLSIHDWLPLCLVKQILAKKLEETGN